MTPAHDLFSTVFAIVASLMGIGSVLFVVLLIVRLANLNKLHPQLRRSRQGQPSDFSPGSLPSSDTNGGGYSDPNGPSGGFEGGGGFSDGGGAGGDFGGGHGGH